MPEHIAQEATKKGLDPIEAYVSLRYAEIKAHENWRKQAENLARIQDQYKTENLSLDQMISSLGGTPKDAGERFQRTQTLIAETTLNPLERYQQMLVSGENSPQIVKQQMTNTYIQLDNERQQVSQELAVEVKRNNLPAVRSLTRRKTRLSMLLWRLEELFKIHCQSENKKASLLLLAEQSKQREAKTKTAAPRSPSSIEETPTTPPPSPVQESVSTLPKQEITLQFVEKERLISPTGPEDQSAWRSNNARVVERALFRAFQQIGINIPFPPDSIDRGVARPKDRYPTNIQGEPLVWLQYSTLKQVSGAWKDVSHAINSHAELVKMLGEMKRVFPKTPPMQRIEVNMRRDVAELLTPENIQKHPGVLTAIAQSLARYLPPGSADRLKDIKFIIPTI